MTTEAIYDYINEVKKTRKAWAYRTLCPELKREYDREVELLSRILDWIEDQEAEEATNEAEAESDRRFFQTGKAF